MTTTAALKVWFGVFVALVFFAGFATGVAVAPRVAARLGLAWRPMVERPVGMGRGFGAGGPGAAVLARRLAEELQLDREQQQRLEAVFAKRRERLQAVNREMRERFEVEQQEFRREIAAILTPAQQERFEAWLRRAPRRGGRGGDRPFF
jgi:Spy/CpxP family protein refolding chaperone